jgi:hypothetical protein
MEHSRLLITDHQYSPGIIFPTKPATLWYFLINYSYMNSALLELIFCKLEINSISQVLTMSGDSEKRRNNGVSSKMNKEE